MTLFEQWKDLIENQTEETFEAFWKEYSETETRIYKDLLAHHTEITKGTFKELAEKYEISDMVTLKASDDASAEDSKDATDDAETDKTEEK